MEKKQEKEPQQKKGPLKDYIKYSSMGFQMIAAIALGIYAGSKLDAYFEVKSRLFTLFLLLFSVIASIYYMIRSLTK